VTFPIKAYQVEGNTLLSAADVDKTLSGFTCAACTYQTVEQALEALKKQYIESGHGSVQVILPEQELLKGIIRLQVIEPRLESVKLNYEPERGREWYDEANIRNSLPTLREGAHVNTPDISSNIQLANENPGKQVEALLRTDDDPAHLQSVVKVSVQPPHKVFFTLDNTGTPQTGEFRMGVGFQHANLFGLDHVFTFNYITPVDSPTKTNLYSVSYRIPIYALGDSIDLIASKSDVNAATANTVAGPLQFSGSGEIFGIHYNLLLPRLGEYSHRLMLGYDYWQLDNQCRLGSFGAQGCGPSAVSVGLMPVTLTYSGQWARPGEWVDFSLSGTQNIPGANNGSNTEFNAARPANTGSGGASANFYLLHASVAWLHAFESGWQTRLVANGQYTSDPLLYVQQFGLGGASAVRGFYEREVTRDMGYVLNSEVYTPNIASKIGFGDQLRGLLFFDHGGGRNNPLAGENRVGITLTSLGGGLQFGFMNSFQLRVNGAYVLDGATIHKSGDARAHLSVYWPWAF
jgi:hemolysin activation/secretion protein